MIGTVLLCILVTEILLSFAYWQPHLNREDRNFQLHRQALRNGQKYDVIILGDSTAGNAFIPKVFGEFTGKLAYNWSETATVSSFSDIYYLREYLRRHPPPDAVIVMRSLTSWPRPMILDAFRERFLQWDLIRYLYARGELSTDQAGQLVLAKLLPTYRFKHNLFRTWRERLDAGSGALNYDDGYIRLDQTLSSPGIVKKDWELIEAARIGNTFRINSGQIALLAYLCSVADESGFPLFLTNSPYVDFFDHDETVVAFAAYAFNAVNRAFTGRKRCHILETQRGYSVQYMANATHLNHTGALFFTHELAREFMGTMQALQEEEQRNR